MEPWRKHQEDAAALLRRLGMTAQTDETIQGVRTAHAIDVTARWTKAGMPQLWIVECKSWARRVSKNAVLAFRSIVDDVGADRGVFLAESGYQRGAVEAADRSNVEITSLEELGRLASDEIALLSLDQLDRRLDAAQHLLGGLMHTTRSGNAISSTTPHGFSLGDWQWGLPALYAQISVARQGVREARSGQARIQIGWDFPKDRVVTAESLEIATGQLEKTVSEIESVVRDAVETSRLSQ